MGNIFRKKRKDIGVVDTLETDVEYQERWQSIWIIYFTMFLMSLGFSVVLTGIWPFLDKLDPNAGKVFMGYVVAANPLGQMLFSPLFGWWGNKIKSVRMPLFSSIGIFTIASAIYSSLESFPMSTVKYWMFISRFLIGVGSANITLCRSYLSDATKLKERTDAVSMVSLAQVLGFIVGPAVQAMVTPLGDHGLTLITNVITLNMYTATGWINVFLGMINFILFLPIIFKEKRIAAREIMIKQGKETEKETWKGIKPDYLSAWTLIIAFFVLVFNFVLLETIGTSLTMDQFAWSKSEALKYMGILMSIGAIIACITFAGIGPLCRKFNERSVLLWGGFFLMVIGRALYIPWGGDPPKMAEILYNNNSVNNNNSSVLDILNNNNYNNNNSMNLNETTLSSTNFENFNITLLNNMSDIYRGVSTTTTTTTTTTATITTPSLSSSFTLNNDIEIVGCPIDQEWCRTTPALTMTQFLLGYFFTCIGYPIGVTLIQTIFSKILGPRPQGVWMGLITGSGCLSRIMGPVCVGIIYTKYGTYAIFGLTTAMMIIAMIWLWMFQDRLITPDMILNTEQEMTVIKINKNNNTVDGGGGGGGGDDENDDNENKRIIHDSKNVNLINAEEHQRLNGKS